MTLRERAIKELAWLQIKHIDVPAIVDSILALIEGQRCEWIPFYQDPDYDDGNWNTGCGQEIFYDYDIREHLDSCPYCPCCGGKIRVKENK